MNNTHFALLESPRGQMLAAREGDALVGLWFASQPAAPSYDSSLLDDANSTPIFRETQSQLNEYFAGKRQEFNLRYELRGTQWQKSVWAELEKIGFGESKSYGEIAQELGRKGAARAVGNAVGKNPVCIVVPCHRVLPAGGGLGGYNGGVENKKALLKVEGIK
ncbi:methylated-DNA--[protein]-cysteine S-methyltransferase [Corynebacterium suicordis]|nr:methylated-DNA--[protein]-cysteine S-methyltransferase [Corynebacterium suicordis]MDR6277278.1 methylated-DNA-[protein]-cysteine S-methyltransferase [Corynebacterium suicordis]